MVFPNPPANPFNKPPVNKPPVNKPIYDNGKLTGYDTGTQSVQIKNPTTGGGGGSGGGHSGGGSSSGGSSSSSNSNTPIPPTNFNTGSYVPGKGFVIPGGWDAVTQKVIPTQVFPTTNPNWAPKGYTSLTGTNNNYVLGNWVKTPSGESYLGKAIIPGTNGLTANDIVNQTQQQAIKAGYSSREAQRMGIISNQGKVPETLNNGLVVDSNSLNIIKLNNLQNIDVNNPTLNVVQKNTRLNQGSNLVGPGIITRPSIIKTQTGNYKDINTGYEEIPTYTYTYVEPQPVGEAKYTPATKEQIDYFESQQRVLRKGENSISMPIGSIRSNIANVYDNIQQSIREDLNGINSDTVHRAVSEAINTPIYLLSGKKEVITSKNPVSEFAGGFVGGIVQDIKEQPIKQIGLYALGAGLGFGGSALAKGVTYIPKVGGALSIGVKGTMLGAGAYYTAVTAVTTAQQMAIEQDYAKKGGILGVNVKDLALTGLGFGHGMKGYQVVEGAITSRGLIENPNVKTGIYPTAPISEQLRLFRENVIEGLSYKPLDKISVAEEYGKFNLGEQLRLKEKAQYPDQHAYPHLKQVGENIQKIIDTYPEFKPYLISEYGSINNAKLELGRAMWHDLYKVGSSSKNEYFGMNHGEVLYQMYKLGKLPPGLEFKPKVAEAIRFHEMTYMKNPTPEWQILSTADRLNFDRFNQGVDVNKLPLKDAMERVKLSDAKFQEEVLTFKYSGDFLKKYKISKGQIHPINAKAGAFHTSSDKFWSKMGLFPKEGRSKAELDVLYASTDVSTPFAGLSNSESTAQGNFIRAIKDFLKPSGSPGVAFLKPEGFKMADIGFTKEKQFETQRSMDKNYPKYAYFKNPIEKGYMEVLGIKSEKEAGARPGAGNYGFEDRKYFVKIKKVKVPIDTFNYEKDLIEKIRVNENNMKKLLKNNDKKMVGIVRPVLNSKPTENKFQTNNIFDKVRGNGEKGITWEEFSSTGRDFVRDTTMQQAKHEVDMAEISMGKLTPKQREILINRRYDKLLQEYKDSLGKKRSNNVIEFKEGKLVGGESSYGLPSPILRIPMFKTSSYPSSSVLSSSYGESISKYSGVSSNKSSSVVSSRGSSNVSGSSGKSGGSSKSGSSSYNGRTSYGGISYPTPIYPFKELITSRLPPLPTIGNKRVEKNLGGGYFAYGKAVKTNSFVKINSIPVTKSRAEDIGSWYVTQSLSRTFKIVKAGKSAKEDFQFGYIPSGYFDSVKNQLREFRIKNKQKYAFGEQFIQKNPFLLSSEAEKRQIKGFRDMEKRMIKNYPKI